MHLHWQVQTNTPPPPQQATVQLTYAMNNINLTTIQFLGRIPIKPSAIHF